MCCTLSSKCLKNKVAARVFGDVEQTETDIAGMSSASHERLLIAWLYLDYG